jgi:NAD(P)-dependent dehydrogenase (short-subunit alcohol dehydrogenase family)
MSDAPRIAMVTGAASGIGRAIAETLLQQGACVACVDVNRTALESLELAYPNRILALTADATNADAVTDTVGVVLARWGKVTILVNNVGGLVGGGRLEAPRADWDATLALTLTSQVLFMHGVVPGMKQQRYGRIVNVASNAGKYRSNTGVGGVSYSAAKGAVLQLTRSAAWELGPYGITVNAVAPGSVLTEAGLREERGLDPDLRTRVLRETPLGHFAAPSEIASIVAFLASDAASYVTGVTITANGGWCTS